MNKKLLTTLTCFTLFMGLAACSSNETASTSKESKVEQEVQKKAEEKGTVKKEKAEQETAEKQRKQQEESTKKEQPTTTSGNTIKGLKDELSIGMPFKDYLAKKKSLNVENPFSISLGKGNVGSVLQAQDGVLVVCIDGEKIFDLKVFNTVDQVKAYEASLKK
ncbi:MULTISPECIES: hypothetical protein [Bacillus cereus group]|uniref:Lipoprotein n=3 Tax=Bacillus cereus group TaxID=86661 RepID=A0A243CYU7_BACTU|nr:MULTISPECIES: hypothetical protein [Bacillus cereus group]EEM56114.1 hypothetical protein bthur0007_60640 [Bacillus thuringiensis serovar monterrey BGSC 4AJ1]EEM86649.1 hypothetical protein bthur0012_53340 [Bacillus thuringiensis serovar pulsiensis BGSC 4CC1]MEB9673547.1 hypothetical protein [Bacillus anthracis]MEB9909383.1 hypothetical protein [Bacillus anthracis]MEC1957251.1 hypothetical protein [Bacillus anthracis]